MEKEYTKDEAIKEAQRCLNCANPQCVKGCPLSNNIPQFIQYIKNEDFDNAYNELLKKGILSEVCSRVCPMAKHCSAYCVRGIKGEPIHINKLEQFVADYMHEDKRYIDFMKNISEGIERRNNIKVAVIGTGPSSIGCAYELIKKGYEVTMFERESFFGGILAYGIPEYRLPKEVVKVIESKLENLGVEINFNTEYGKDITEQALLDEGYKAIYLGIGLQSSSMLNVEGKNLENVYSGNEFLYFVNSINNGIESKIDLNDIKGKNVVVVGGGNVAIDCAISAKRLGAKTSTLVYRRTENELLMEKSERELAEKLNVDFNYLSLPIKFIGDKRVTKIECVKMYLGEVDNTGRRTPVVQNGTNYIMDADYIVVCVGSKIDSQIVFKDSNIDYDDYSIKINDDGQTNIPYIFAGGDTCLTSNKTVAMAAKTGEIAANGIDKYLSR